MLFCTVIVPVVVFILNALLLFPVVMVYVSVCPWSGSLAVIVPINVLVAVFSFMLYVCVLSVGGSFMFWMFMVMVLLVLCVGVPLSVACIVRVYVCVIS